MADDPSGGLPPLSVPTAADVPVATDSVRSGPDLDPALLRLLPLLGTWRGAGKGSDVDGTDYDFGQQMRFTHDGRALLSYESVTWQLDAIGQAGSVLSRERGIWRPRPEEPDGIEVLLVHDEGFAEVSVGTVAGTRFELRSDVLARTGTAPEIAAVHRLFGLVEGDLLYAWDRSTAAAPELTPYMSARLRRVSDALQVANS